MQDLQSILPLITGAGGALVVLALIAFAFYIGKLHSDVEYRAMEAERDYWRTATEKRDDAIALERKAVNETAEAGRTNIQVLEAMARLAAEGRAGRYGRPGLNPRDAGL